MTAVVYQSISKTLAATEIIRDLSLKVEDSEFIVLLGASGCGKTTLLRMTAGLETISSGDLYLDEVRINDVHPRDRNIAMVFQNYALYPNMSVFDNIAFSLKVKRLSDQTIRKKVEQAAKILNLIDYLDRYPRELSGGQRQRVAMGRVLVRDVGLFLFDEPLSNLDAKLRARMRVEIRQLHDQLGATTIYVTHDQIEAMTMADRIVLMRAGQIEQVGTPDELFDKPATIFAAGFIGSPSINFLAGGIKRSGRSWVFHRGDVHIPLGTKVQVTSGQKVICGLRPTDLRLDQSGKISGVLKLSEKTGADKNLHMEVSGEALVACVPRDTQTDIGTTMRLSIAPEVVHLFDPVTERRILQGN